MSENEGQGGAALEDVWTTFQAQHGDSAQDPARTLRCPGAIEWTNPDRLRVLTLAAAETADETLDLQIGEPLGAGGMGQVSAAMQTCLRREVAVKTLKDGLRHPDAASGLVAEALHAGCLEHPNIIPVHLLGRDAEGAPLLVMKRVRGTTWQDLDGEDDHPWWARWPGDRLRAHVEICLRVADALHFAHSRGVAHRDVKPTNVMVGAFGEVILLDWGVACRLADAREEGDRIVGTVSYMAPEMLQPDGLITARTDVYLLAASLHRALTGRPRHGDGSYYTALYSAVHSEPFDYPAEVPAELAELLNRAMHVDPSQRPPDALAMRRDLESFLRHRGSVQMTERALDELAALREGDLTQAEEVHGRFAVCRARFEQALREWPGNIAAQEGLQGCLEFMIRRELARANRGFAESLLSALPRPVPELEEQLESLRERLEQQLHAEQDLRQLQHQLDPDVSRMQRAAWFAACGLGAGALVGAPRRVRRVSPGTGSSARG